MLHCQLIRHRDISQSFVILDILVQIIWYLMFVELPQSNILETKQNVILVMK